MKQLKKLPDGEFEVMKAVWSMEEPVTSPMVARWLETKGKDKSRKPQTIITVLSRLEKKGYLKSVKIGKEREYTSIVTEDAYMAYEAGQFFSKFQNGSAVGLVKALYREKKLDEADAEELKKWLEEQ